MARSMLPIRLKLFIAMVALAVVGASGGLLSLVSLRELSRTHQLEQDEIAAHEEIHGTRIVLLSLLNRATRYLGAPAPAARQQIQQQLDALEGATHACASCHTRGDPIVAQLASLRAQAIPILELDRTTGPETRTEVQRRLEDAAGVLEDKLAQMEDRVHKLLERQRADAQGGLRPSAWQHLALVAGGLILAIVLAWLVSQAMSRPILPLIAAARRVAVGEVGAPIEVPRDRDLAQVATALNELTDLVARHALEEGRRHLLDHTISSQEEERKRVARELHDELGQSLSALLMEVRSRKLEPAGGEPGGLEARICGMLDEVRRMASDLRPALLDDLGLHAALGRLAEEARRRDAVAADFQAVGFEPAAGRLPGTVETVLYRVAQEALNNVVRHAHAHHVGVVLARRPDEVSLIIEDDGVGFDVEAQRQRRGSLGLIGMRERVTLAGGSMTIDSEPGRGTTLRARIPLGAGRGPS